jgi:hypothetical protein
MEPTAASELERAAPPGPRAPRRGRGWRSLATRALLASVVAFVGAECALRWAMFSSSALGLPLVERIRRPNKYAHPQFDDLYWELNDQFLRAKGELQLAPRDELLGWRSSAFAPETFEHADTALARDKRPVLLFGDSYAQGIVPYEDCFQSLFAYSSLARDHVLINYGVGGYGPDQVLLLMRRVLDKFEAQNPIVVVGLLVDDDLDRCALTLREQPKPSFKLVDGELVLRESPLPTPLERFERGPSWTPSYLWRYLTRGTKLLPQAVRDALTDHPGRDKLKEKLASKVLAELLGEIERRGLGCVFVLFHNLPSMVERERCGWRDAALRDPLNAAGIAIVEVRDAMLETAARTGEDLMEYFDNVPQPGGHYNARGNRIAFEALARTLSEEFELPYSPAPLTVRDMTRVDAHGPDGGAEFQVIQMRKFPEPRDRPRLSLRVGAGGPTRVQYELGGRATRFESRVKFAELDNDSRGSVELSFFGDGALLERRSLRRADAEAELSIDLRGRQQLEIVATDAGDGHAGDWIALTRPRFE